MAFYINTLHSVNTLFKRLQYVESIFYKKKYMLCGEQKGAIYRC